MITRHAKQRMQQRGFSEQHIKFIMQYGKKQRIGSAIRFTFSRKRAVELNYLGVPRDFLEKCKGSFVVAKNNIVITIAHLY